MDAKSQLPSFYAYSRGGGGGGGKRAQQKNKHCRVTPVNTLVAAVLGMGLLITILNIYQLKQMKEEHLLHGRDPVTVVEGNGGKGTNNSPVVWILGKHLETGYLDHVKAVFQRLGFVMSNGEDDWDVLWAHDYPFITMSTVMKRLSPHQKVNHFPGSGFITNKGSLATLQLDAFPRAFRIPRDKDKLFKFAEENPAVLWVQKNNNHRGVRIKQLQELDFATEGSFVQEFVAKPLLIDDRKFDIGVYAVLTSINPLRVYIVNDDALIRFCSKNYYPFDAADVDRYVVNDKYTAMWQMPSLSDTYMHQKYSFKETFNRYMISQGRNVSKIWGDIEDTIRAIYRQKHSTLLSSAAKYKTTKNFFELVRFDFVLDEKLKVYLMEVNMSPNLSTGHFKANRRLYEHVIYSSLRVSGVASMVENHFHASNKAQDEMLVSDREIAVFSDWCTLSLCLEQCENVKCSLCSHCLTSSQRADFKDAYLEHINRGGCKRLFPVATTLADAIRWDPEEDSLGVANYSDSSRNIYMWFIGMCRKDHAFCS